MIKLTVFITLVTLATTDAVGSYLPSFRCVYQNLEQKNVKLNTFTQQLDNFDRTNRITWKQRYYSNDEFYAPGGPIFVFLGGQYDIKPHRLTVSTMANFAEKLNGIMFFIEHRFYGESRPTNNTSVENLRFLTVEQALADIAHFISYVTSGKENSAVIVVGGHYSGSLAVWFRQKYPHLSTGAWASGAPLQGNVNLEKYKEIAGNAYLSVGGQDCYKKIEEGFSTLERYLADGNNDYVEKLFSACDPIATDADVTVFKKLLSELFAFVPQLNHNYPIQGVCDTIMEGTAESDMDRIARHIKEVMKRYFKDSCVPSSYDAIIKLLKQTDGDLPFGHSDDQSWWHAFCGDLFGDEFTEETIQSNVARFNAVFGGNKPGVTNTILVQGDLDPWNGMGLQTQLNPSSHSIFISGTSQNLDFYEMEPHKDTPQLVAARDTIFEIIAGWVASP